MSALPTGRSSTLERTRVRRILQRLRRAYPDAHCELVRRSPLELLIATILSAQCSDKQVNRVTVDLFARYRTAADYTQAPLPELALAIRRLGLYRNKARNIQACCRQLIQRHHGQVPTTLDELLQLTGVGRKTANVVLGNGFGISVGIVVDTHVARLAQRLGLSPANTPVKIEQDLMRQIPRAQWILVSHWLIWHGRRRCTARNPDCGHCEILKFCPRRGLERMKPAQAQ